MLPGMAKIPLFGKPGSGSSLPFCSGGDFFTFALLLYRAANHEGCMYPYLSRLELNVTDASFCSEPSFLHDLQKSWGFDSRTVPGVIFAVGGRYRFGPHHRSGALAVAESVS